MQVGDIRVVQFSSGLRQIGVHVWTSDESPSFNANCVRLNMQDGDLIVLVSMKGDVVEWRGPRVMVLHVPSQRLVYVLTSWYTAVTVPL